MKFFLRSGWRIGCVIIALIFLVSCFSNYIQPALFSPGVFFALAFPYLFLVIFVLLIINIFINRKLSFVLLICVCFGAKNIFNSFAFHLPKQWVTAKDDSTFRIISWNVEDFVNLLPGSEVRIGMINLINSENADVLCMQEFTEIEKSRWKVSVEHELDSIGYKYHYYSKDYVGNNVSDQLVISGVAIFSKHAFSNSRTISIRHEDENESLIYTTVNLNNKPINVFTAHLASYDLYGDTTGSDLYRITYHRKKLIQHQLRETEQLHQQEAEIINNLLSKSTYPTVYCGDMNATPCSYNYRIIKGNAYDAFLEKGSGIGATFYKILPTLRIDYCFPSKAFKIQQCKVVERKLSDHYPVVTDIKWK